MQSPSGSSSPTSTGMPVEGAEPSATVTATPTDASTSESKIPSAPAASPVDAEPSATANATPTDTSASESKITSAPAASPVDDNTSSSQREEVEGESAAAVAVPSALAKASDKGKRPDAHLRQVILPPEESSSDSSDDDDDQRDPSAGRVPLTNTWSDDKGLSPLAPSASHFAGKRSFGKSSRYHMQTQTTLENMSANTAKCFIYSWYIVLIVSLGLSIPLGLKYDCENICGDTNCTLAFDGGNATASTFCTRVTNANISQPSTDESMTMTLPMTTATEVAQSTEVAQFEEEQPPIVPELSLVHKIYAYFYGQSMVLGVTEDRVSPSHTAEEDAEEDQDVYFGRNKEPVMQHNFTDIFENRNKTVNITWRGAFRKFTKLNREPVIAINIAAPETDSKGFDYSGLKQFRLNFTLQLAIQDPDQNTTYDVRQKFDILFLCVSSLPRCNPVSLPLSVNITELRSYKLAAINIPFNMRQGSYEAAISAVFQRESWTVFEVVARYIFLVLLVFQLGRFILLNERALVGIPARLVAKRPSASEQRWCIFLIVSCIFFVQPFVAIDIFEPKNVVLSWWRHRYPLYFVVTVLMFFCSLVSLTLTSVYSFHVLIGNAAFLAIIVTLDTVYAGLKRWDMTLDLCPNLDCGTIGTIVYSLIGAYVLLCVFMTFYVSRNLGKIPYIASRQRQLAMRLVILMFSTFSLWFIVNFGVTAAVYRGIALLTINALDNVLLAGVAVAFVMLLSSSYVYVLRPENRVPFHPLDRRWKKVVWSSNWFNWYASHGGVAYVFYSEKEELKFWKIQAQGALLRNQLSKAKRAADTSAPGLEGSPSRGDYGTTAAAPATDDDLASPLLASPLRPNSDTETATTATDTDSMSYSRATDDVDEDESELSRKKSLAQQAKSGITTAIERPMFFLDDMSDKLTMFAVGVATNVNWRKPFFNAETCVDAFNLAWEAYGVNAAKGDQVIEDWLGAKDVCRILCCGAKLWQKPTAEEDDEPTMSSQRTVASAASVSTFSRDSHSLGDEAVTKLNGSHASTSSRATTTKPPGKDTYYVNTEQYGYTTIAIYEKLNVQVVISLMDSTLPCHKHKQPRIAVAFRGTDNLSNAVQDARFRKTYWDEMGESSSMWEGIKKGLPFQPRVHTGFLTIWEDFKESVHSTVRQLRLEKPDAKVLVTGHSLGGGLAVLCAYSLYKQATQLGLPNAAPIVYTFGMPHAGNSAFQAEYDHKIPNTFRVVNESDAISHFSLVSGKHVGLEIDIDRFGNFIVDPMYLEKLFRPTQGKGFSISQHSMEGYATSINALLEKNKGFGTCPSRCLEKYHVVDLQSNKGVSNFIRDAFGF